jgi:prepilin-type N-terminal cleavage/methylation domain-containing protein
MIKKAHNTNTSGFTLVEISIVLVIIGLLVGGILVGRDLIHAAELRSAVSQIDKYNAAANTVRLKFNCLPGDCADASTQGLGTAGGAGDDGNGNGVIDGQSRNSATFEFHSFWYHLSQARLVAWSPGNNYNGAMTYVNDGCAILCPPLSFPGVSRSGLTGGWTIWSPFSSNGLPSTSPYSAVTLSHNHYFWITGIYGSGGADASAVLIPADAFAIDKKVDDGLPYGGSINAAGDNNFDPYGATNPAEAAAGGIACVSNSMSPMQYNVRNTSRNGDNMCSLLIRTTF